MNDEIVGKQEGIIEDTKSEEIGELVKALAKVQGTIKPAKRDSINPFFKAKYADLTSVWDSCRKELSENNLVVIQTMKNNDGLVTVLTTLAHGSGQWIRGEISLKPVKTDPQGYGSALTYARRYSLAAIIGIATGEDDDAEDATRGKRKEKVKTTYLGNKAEKKEKEKKALARVNAFSETEVKDEPGDKVLSEEEAQKEQNKALEPEHDQEWQDKTRRTWYRMVEKMYEINYHSDEPSYRAWMVENFDDIDSYTKLTDNHKTTGINLMVIQANKHEEEKTK